MQVPSVAIVILNWNGLHYLRQFLPSVLGTSYTDVKVVVADNASTDDSVTYLQQNFPQVKVILLQQNFGFAKGYNEALKQVDTDYFVLLNSDVEVTSNWLNPIISLLEKEDRFAACQPKILSYKNKAMFEYAGACGGWLDAYGYPFARGRIFDSCEEDKGQYNDTSEVFWASGAAMVIKSHVYRQLKGFDEYFFAHQEEIDICWRAQLIGYKIFCCPDSIVYHVGGGTLPRGNSKKTYLNFRNNQIMLAKNMTWGDKWWKIPARLILDMVSAVKGLLWGDAGYFLSIVKAHFAFLYWLLFGDKKWRVENKQRLIGLSGVYRGNVVWQHFACRKNRFFEIVRLKKSGV